MIVPSLRNLTRAFFEVVPKSFTSTEGLIESLLYQLWYLVKVDINYRIFSPEMKVEMPPLVFIN
jgi:hypothetical protein